MRVRHDPEAQPAAPAALVLGAGLATAAVALLLSTHAVAPAAASGFLPRWDLAAHLLNGWTTYDHLVSGRLGSAVWDIWSQGYWPPGQSLFQVPFYAAFRGDISGGLHSSTAAYALTAGAAVVLLGRLAGRGAWLPAAITVTLMATSPFFLAYATVAMSEMLGALAQMTVLACYASYEQRRSAATTRRLAAALSLLFFTKYNYFILLAVPLAAHAAFTETAGTSAGTRVRAVARGLLAWGSSTGGRVTLAYLVAVAGVLAAGGVSFAVGTNRLAFRTVGYSLHPVLYAWLWWAWRARRDGRGPFRPRAAPDPRVRPLLRWFVVPVTIWLASPYPNHIKDLVYLVVNVPMGAASASGGLAANVTTLRSDYFAHPAVFVVALVTFLTAAARFASQPPLVRLLLVTAVLQFAMVTIHHTRDPRFVLLAMPPAWIVVGYQLGGWLSGRWPRMSTLVAIVTLCAGVVGAATVMAAPPFTRLAAEHYVPSATLGSALATIRGLTPPRGDVVFVGRRDTVSPALVKWHLGPPGGGRRFPRELTREADLTALDTAAMIVLIEPSDVSTAVATDRTIRQVEAGALQPATTFAIVDLAVSMRVFLRPESD